MPKWRVRNPLQGSFQEIGNVASIVNWESRRLYELLKEADAERRSGFVATERSSNPVKSLGSDLGGLSFLFRRGNSSE
jgi:hypothetical protein